MNQTDYIIVGAGLAGLHTGIGILRNNRNASVCILEKYNYIGGRVITYKHTIEGFGKVQWENGAGRIHSTQHKLVMNYIRKYKLTTAPIKGEIRTLEGGKFRENLFESTYLPMIVQMLSSLAEKELANHTIRELLTEIVGSAKTDEMLREFAYDSEVDTMRADWALKQFCHEMGTHEGYVVCVEGLSSLTGRMAKEFEDRGGKIQKGCGIKSVDQKRLAVIDDQGQEYFAKKGIILALHHDALCSLLRGWELLKYVTMRPLLRCYAVFEDPVFSGIPRYTGGKERYFIPADNDGQIAMVSYTDGTSAEPLLKILKEKGVNELQKALFIKPKPLFFKAHPWYSGCSYWLPGEYDVKQASLDAHYPFGKDVPIYVCGESFSRRQAWMEGALEHADSLLKILFG